jgi:hypothetical protein
MGMGAESSCRMLSVQAARTKIREELLPLLDHLLAERNMPTLDYLLEQSQTTVADLAKASGLEAPRVQAIVDGRWTPSPDERQAIATALGMPVEQVAFGHNMNARNIRFHRFGLKEDFNASGDEQRE